MLTLLFLKAAGLTQVQTRCVACGADADIPINAPDLPEATLLSDVAALRPIACKECSAAAVVVPPDIAGRSGDDD